MKTISATTQVTDLEFKRFAALIYERTGNRVSPQKKTLLSNRVRRCARETGHASFRAYYDHIKALPLDAPEWDLFLQQTTTHETYLFRDEVQWEWFRKEYLPWISKQTRSGNRPKRLRIWSAAASTGDEAFTIASCIAASLLGKQDWDIRILGTDIGIEAVEQARGGRFGERAMRQVPKDFVRRFFTHMAEEDAWAAKPQLTEMVEFKQHNLLEPLAGESFDLIFLKNVLIYFDADSKERVLEHIRAAIKPGGELVVGGADGVSEHLREFDRQRTWLLRAPTHEEAAV